VVADKVRRLIAEHDATKTRIADLERPREDVNGRSVEARIEAPHTGFNDGMKRLGTRHSGS
jgi:hypothetical protein